MVFKSPETALRSLIKSLPHRPIQRSDLDRLVAKSLSDTPSKLPPDVRKGQWELALKNVIFDLAVKEGAALEDPETSYYDKLKDRLDLVLTFTEHDACEQTFPFTTLQDLLETQTISSCSHVFSWIEARAARLTDGMVPQKGKALVLLRTLNDLLRRLSKMGSNTIFCGRILTFLSGVFPLGERSGVNLRGEYGPTWEGVRVQAKEDEVKGEENVEAMHVDDVEQAKDGEEKPAPSPPKAVDKKAEKKEEFYNTFWSLQLPFSRPPLFATPQTFEAFKEAVNKVIPVIKEATAKDRAMTGSRSVMTNAAASASNGTLKRKRDVSELDDMPSSKDNYFFAKFLTSPELLDLEIADTHFRRQFVFQLLILLHHLLTFTKAAKATWVSQRNRSLQMEFTLEQAEAQWVTETIAKAHEELKQTTPGGRVFADTVAMILEREKNWVRWKNDLCAPFDREPFAVPGADGRKVGLEEATKEARAKMRGEPAEWEHSLGSAPLTEIWEMGYRGLRDLESPFQPGEVRDFVKKVKLEDTRIEMRKKTLTKQAERKAAARAKAAVAAAAPVPAPDATVETPAAPAAAAPPLEASPSRPAAPPAGSPPLHPSLPARPGTSSSSQPSPRMGHATAQPSTPALPAPAPTPAPTPAAAAPAPAPTSTPPAAAPIVLPPDEQINKLEENKQRWSWLALRTAREQYLVHFAKVGTGDIALLAQEIEREKERGKERAESPATIAGKVEVQKEAEADVKMEER